MTKNTPLSETADVLYRIKRGLAGYVSYLAACEMNQSFSEYILYEPILRILMARGFEVQCEYPCPGVVHAPRGDKKRIDFYAKKNLIELAIEVKWARSKAPRISDDVAKLASLFEAQPNVIPLLCIFGRESHLIDLRLPAGLSERGSLKVADLGKTKYGCRVFQLKRKNELS